MPQSASRFSSKQKLDFSSRVFWWLDWTLTSDDSSPCWQTITSLSWPSCHGLLHLPLVSVVFWNVQTGQLTEQCRIFLYSFLISIPSEYHWPINLASSPLQHYKSSQLFVWNFSLISLTLVLSINKKPLNWFVIKLVFSFLILLADVRRDGWERDLARVGVPWTGFLFIKWADRETSSGRHTSVPLPR